MITENEIVEGIMKDTENYLKTYRGRTFIDIYIIMSSFKVGAYVAKKVKRVVEKKLGIDT